jgi:Xaa-Pro dipeptidase
MENDRLPRLLKALEESEFQAIALNPGPGLFHLTGLSFHLSERPVVGLFAANQRPILILPELERSKAEASCLDLDLIDYGEDLTDRIRAFSTAAKQFRLSGRLIGVDPLRFRVFELRLLEAAAPDATFGSAETIFANLRMTKDEREIASLRQAVVVAQEALESTLPHIDVGVSERELTSELVLQLLRHGSDPELPFSPIVASGPNSALPHALPSDRKLQVGDLLILDWGARMGGYISDITRTFAIGQIDPELGKVHQIVQQANQAGRAAIRPGATCGSVDAAARSVIERAGYGEYFIHRTGHGIGLEAHEEPYISAGNDRVLAPGMTFTVEPGIYLPGRGGVRVEDDVLVTPKGGESLSSYARELEIIASS